MFMRLGQVLEFTGLSRSRLYALMRDDEFPRQAKIGERAVAWPRAEVEEWAKRLIAAREQTCKERSAIGRRLVEARQAKRALATSRRARRADRRPAAR